MNEATEADTNLTQEPTSLKELPPKSWKETVSEFLNQGEQVEYGKVIGEGLRAGKHVRSEPYVGEINVCNSENAIITNLSVISKILMLSHRGDPDEIGQVEALYEIEDNGQKGLLLAVNFREPPIALSPKRAAIYSDEPEIVFIGLLPTKIAGEMKMVVIKQEEGELQEVAKTSDQPGYTRKVPTWKSSSTVVGHLHTLPLPEEYRKGIVVPRGASYFMRNGIAEKGRPSAIAGGSPTLKMPEEWTDQSLPADGLKFFSQAIKDLRSSKFPYKNSQ